MAMSRSTDEAGPSEPSPESVGRSENRIPLNPLRARSAILGFLLCVPVTYAVVNANQSTIFSVMVPPISALLGLIVLNLPLRLFAPKWSLGMADLLVIYAIVSVAGTVAGEYTSVAAPIAYNIPSQAKTDAMVRDYFVKQFPDQMAVKE